MLHVALLCIFVSQKMLIALLLKITVVIYCETKYLTQTHWVTAKIPKRLFTQTQTQLFGFPHFLKRRQNSPKHLFINLTEFNDYIE